jgi:hypothetical protein
MRGYHKWALAHSSSCMSYGRFNFFMDLRHRLRKMRRKISWTDGRTVYPPPLPGSGGIKIVETKWWVNMINYASWPFILINMKPIWPTISEELHSEEKRERQIFSSTIDCRNLIFGHKLHIGMPYCG